MVLSHGNDKHTAWLASGTAMAACQQSAHGYDTRAFNMVNFHRLPRTEVKLAPSGLVDYSNPAVVKVVKNGTFTGPPTCRWRR